MKKIARIKSRIGLLAVLLTISLCSLGADNINYINNFGHTFNPNLPNNPYAPISTIHPNRNIPYDSTLYVCFIYLQPYMVNSYQSVQCDTYTGYCTKLGVQRGYWPQVPVECRIQTTPCQGKWILFGKFNQDGSNASSVTPQPYSYRVYNPYRSAQAAYLSCIINKVSINKPPF